MGNLSSIGGGLDKTMMGRLLSLNFMKKAENLIGTGPTGTGKSWLGQAIARQACLMQLKTRYFVTGRFFDAAKLDGSWPKLIGEGTIADAILDRVLYSFHRIELKGESLRKKQRLVP